MRLIRLSFIFLSLILFFLIFIFPYEKIISYLIKDIEKKSRLSIEFEKEKLFFIGVKFYNLKIKNLNQEIFNSDEAEIFYALNKLKFNLNKNSGKIEGDLNKNILYFKIKEFELPTFIGKTLGEGKINLSGFYKIKENQGEGIFSLDLKNIPNTIINEPINFKGKFNLIKDNLNLNFLSLHKNLKGQGNLNILINKSSFKDSNLNGLINLGIFTLVLEGTLENSRYFLKSKLQNNPFLK